MRGTWRKALAAVLMLCALPALAQDSGHGRKDARGGDMTFKRVGGIDIVDSTKYMLPLTTSGTAIKTSEQNRDRDWVQKSMAISTQFTNTVREDESAAIVTLGWSRMALRIFVSPAAAGDSAAAYVFAIEVRAHDSAIMDTSSSSIFEVGRFRGGLNQVGTADTARVDTVGTLRLYEGTPRFYVYANASCASTAPTQATEHELVFVANRQEWGVGASGLLTRSRYVLLTDRNGAWFSAPWTSIKVRYLGAAARLGTQAWVCNAPTVSIRVDVVGWR